MVQCVTLRHMSMMEPAPQGIVHIWTRGDRLAKARKAVANDQESFAAMVGISKGTVSNYENDTTERVKPLVIRQWALATGYDAAWLMTGESGTTETVTPRYPEPLAA